MAKQIGALKIGGEKPWKIYTAAALGVFALVLLVKMLLSVFGGPDTPAPVTQTTQVTKTTTTTQSTTGSSAANNAARKAAANGSKSLDPTLRFDLLAQSESIEYTGAGRNVFSLTAPPPPIPQPIAPIRPVDTGPQGPPPPPPKPRILLTFYGYATSRGAAKRVFLINPNADVFIAAEGDIVDRRYKIVKISASSVDIQDILNDDTQTINLSTQG